LVGVSDNCYATYGEAATAFGLFREVREAEYVMQDSIATYARPSQLRFLFEICQPSTGQTYDSQQKEVEYLMVLKGLQSGIHIPIIPVERSTYTTCQKFLESIL
jgi:hypothetical protein